MDKKERAALAKQHVRDVKQDRSYAIKFSQVNTLIYGGPDGGPIDTCNDYNNMKVSIEACDTVTTLFKMSNEKGNKIAILNFSSYKNPGGGYLKGSFTQEESICAESTLYPVLTKFTDTYYDWNRGHLNHSLYENRALYSPNIVFEKNNKVVWSDVITCAAPNYSSAKKQKVSWEDNKKVLKDRIKFVLDIAEENGVSTLILGAWGCGVFGQNPQKVAEYFLTELIDRSFSKVIFAVPKSNRNKNYILFKNVIDEFNRELGFI